MEQNTKGPSQPALAPAKAKATDTWEYRLRKYLLLLATLVATVTYGVGFTPPGGVWENTDAAAGHLAGDPIIRHTNYARYLAFFYCNATAFASSLVVIVSILLLAVIHEKWDVWVTVVPLRVVMVLDLVSLMAAFAAGTCRDKFSTIYSSVLVIAVFAYLVVQMVMASLQDKIDKQGESSASASASSPDKIDKQGESAASASSPDKIDKQGVPAASASASLPDRGNNDDDDEELAKEKRLRKVLMLLATFAVSVTYVAGLSTPGGFWGADGGGHRVGTAVLKNRYDARLTAFFVCNTTAFVASLLIIVLLLDGKLRTKRKVRSSELYGCIIVALAGLVGAYAAGGCREADTTVYVLALVGAVLVYMIIHVALVKLAACCLKPPAPNQNPSLNDPADAAAAAPSPTTNAAAADTDTAPPPPTTTTTNDGRKDQDQQLNKARSLVLLLATLVATITYQAGLDPPGGLWQNDSGEYKAGDPILLTTDVRRFKVFFYCNSVAFVASLVTVFLVQHEDMLKHHVLEVAMVLDLFGLIGAYAAGSCRDVSTSVYVMALAGAVLVYVVIHVIFFTLDGGNSDDQAELRLLEKRRKRLLLFAILAATVTYQSGLTPPGGFIDSGERAGDSVLLSIFPRRYNAFFYCNSVTFMLSVALIVLLVNPNLYRPAIRSWALSVCTAAGLSGLMGAYAAGSTQHLKTSIYIFVLVAVVVFCVLLLLLVFLWKKRLENRAVVDTPVADHDQSHSSGQQDEEANNIINKHEQALGEKRVSLLSMTDNKANTPVTDHDQSPSGQQAKVISEHKKAVEKKMHAKREYLMLLGILVASITYQAGLDPPGGFWQSDDSGHRAGNPVMHDNRRPRYLVFFYSNTISFDASIVVILLLLLPVKSALQESKGWLRVMNTTLVLDLLGLLVAYAAGSSRHWKTSVYVVALIFAVLAYVIIHVMVSSLMSATAGRRSTSEGAALV